MRSIRLMLWPLRKPLLVLLTLLRILRARLCAVSHTLRATDSACCSWSTTTRLINPREAYSETLHGLPWRRARAGRRSINAAAQGLPKIPPPELRRLPPRILIQQLLRLDPRTMRLLLIVEVTDLVLLPGAGDFDPPSPSRLHLCLRRLRFAPARSRRLLLGGIRS